MLFFCSGVFGQKELTKKQKLDALPNTIENQFIKINEQSNNWRQYKMITIADFKKLQLNIIDSVISLKQTIEKKQSKIDQKNEEIIRLDANINSLLTRLDDATDQGKKISLFGLAMNKGSYQVLVWSAIILLKLSVLFFFFKYYNSNKLTKIARVNLKEIDTEFEQFRKKSLAKEQKLRRQLQDEINKQRGI